MLLLQYDCTIMPYPIVFKTVLFVSTLLLEAHKLIPIPPILSAIVLHVNKLRSEKSNQMPLRLFEAMLHVIVLSLEEEKKMPT